MKGYILLKDSMNASEIITLVCVVLWNCGFALFSKGGVTDFYIVATGSYLAIMGFIQCLMLVMMVSTNQLKDLNTSKVTNAYILTHGGVYVILSSLTYSALHNVPFSAILALFGFIQWLVLYAIPKGSK
jgi:hypothetical protein